MAASVQQPAEKKVGEEEEQEEHGGQSVAGEGVKLSRAEAKLAWLSAGGDIDKAVRQLLRDRRAKVGILKITA